MKTPKEKADEIIDKHYWIFGDGYLGHQHIQHALLAVDEIVKQLTPIEKAPNNKEAFKYWQEVKTEINNL